MEALEAVGHGAACDAEQLGRCVRIDAIEVVQTGDRLQFFAHSRGNALAQVAIREHLVERRARRRWFGKLFRWLGTAPSIPELAQTVLGGDAPVPTQRQ